MGWNDHIEFEDVRCRTCGDVGTWQFWNKVALARYSGDLGKHLGLDVTKNGRCPYCGATEYDEVDPDE